MMEFWLRSQPTTFGTILERVRPDCASAEVPVAAGEKLVVMATRDRVHVRVVLGLALKVVKLPCQEGSLNSVPDPTDLTTARS